MNPDVVLMDLRMPNVDGIQATRAIKRLVPSVQVIMLSAYGDSALKMGAEEAGVSSYLIKGCPPDLIREALLLAWRSMKRARPLPGGEAADPALPTDPDGPAGPRFGSP